MKINSLFIVLIFITQSLFALHSYRLSFDVKVQDEVTSLNRFSCFVLPNDTVSLIINDSSNNDYSIFSSSGEIIEDSYHHWLFIAPDKIGQYEVLIQKQNSDEQMTLLVFVLTPATDVKGEYLNGYRIGKYPSEKYKNKENYRNPPGFIEVNEENKDVYLSPHFQLKQFLCKQKSGWPKYVVIKQRMLMKLELVLEKLNESGINVTTLFLMSAYRTPFYNKAIGNVKYSRHIFGDAIDLYVDDNYDAVMDDLNKDGIISMKDAEVIQSIVNKMDNDPEYNNLLGGMGKYNKNAAHTYFIHIDTRGYKARW